MKRRSPASRGIAGPPSQWHPGSSRIPCPHRPGLPCVSYAPTLPPRTGNEGRSSSASQPFSPDHPSSYLGKDGVRTETSRKTQWILEHRSAFPACFCPLARHGGGEFQIRPCYFHWSLCSCSNGPRTISSCVTLIIDNSSLLCFINFVAWQRHPLECGRSSHASFTQY